MYTIGMLNGFAWERAIANAIKRLNKKEKFRNYTFRENGNEVAEMLELFETKFDENGEFVEA
jgi:fructose-1,6-bisphosphatase